MVDARRGLLRVRRAAAWYLSVVLVDPFDLDCVEHELIFQWWSVNNNEPHTWYIGRMSFTRGQEIDVDQLLLDWN